MSGEKHKRVRCIKPGCLGSKLRLTIEEWNTRPIEDELQQHIKELEEELDKKEVCQECNTPLFGYSWCTKCDGEYLDDIKELGNVIVELKQRIKKLEEEGE